jgi:DNA invertase Pin-like site-specific DNA recombinase
LRTFAYLRVSTKEQLDMNGLDRQRDAVRAYADRAGFTIARTFEEQQSGGAAFEDRLMLIEMLELAVACDVGAIIVERADRVARDLMAQELFFVKCQEQNVKVFAADTGQELTCKDGDPTRVLLRQLLGALAQWEKAVIVKKLQDGRRRTAAKTGRPCGGPRRFGDNPDPAENADERHILVVIRDLRRRGMTYQVIAERLRQLGHRAPSGQTYWHSSTVMRLDKSPEPPTS